MSVGWAMTYATECATFIVGMVVLDKKRPHHLGAASSTGR